MKHLTKKTLPIGFAALLVGGITLGTSVLTANAQENKETKAASSRVNSGGRDPFKKYEPPRVLARKGGQVMPPTIQARIQQYKAQKMAAMTARVAAPKPTTAFLLSEVQVIGISRTPRGYAAIVEATPIKLSYVIYPGERFYDGQLVAIEDSRLVFRREIVFGDGRRERSVEMKPLRQPSVADSLAALKSTPTESPAAEPSKSSEVKPAAEKP